jgi:hypothetical protein
MDFEAVLILSRLVKHCRLSLFWMKRRPSRSTTNAGIQWACNHCPLLSEAFRSSCVGELRLLSDDAAGGVDDHHKSTGRQIRYVNSRANAAFSASTRLLPVTIMA